MNRLIPDAMPMAPTPEPASNGLLNVSGSLLNDSGQSLNASALIPGQKTHMQAMARELGISSRGTKAEIWSRISAKQGENVGRRVRAPRMPTESPTATEAAPPVDDFDEMLGRFEAYLGAR